MDSGNATLTSAVYVEGKGIVFTFHVDGKFSKSGLKGSVQVDGGGRYGLDCVQVDASTVKYTASKFQGNCGLKRFSHMGWFQLLEKTPELPAPTSHYCYNIYDWRLDEPTEWVVASQHCQDTPAEYSDIITWYNPDWDWEMSTISFRRIRIRIGVLIITPGMGTTSGPVGLRKSCKI